MSIEQNIDNIIPVNIEQEVQTSYLNYAMSVIVSRALPDVRDGLKPVHRRILYSMSDLGISHASQHKKTGRIVGDVLGKYHPHGDQSIYDALVRLAQDFNMRYPLIDGQGNFGSIDDDPPAAMRYTEARLARIAEEMLRDIKKETVDFRENYDATLKEPTVLPAALPYLLINGVSGIAVGMATSIPPHNLREVANAIDLLISNPDCSIEDLSKVVVAPDFPTGGIIYGAKDMPTIYATGRGRICVRGRVHIEENGQEKETIIINELPYQVSKNVLINRIVELVKGQKIIGIFDIRDESDKDGMRIVIEIKRDADAEIICNQLYRMTSLQTNFNPNMVALIHGTPKLLNLKEIISSFVEHRHEVIVRRSQYDLRVHEARKHLLEGLLIAIDNIDEVIKIIRSAQTVAVANENLQKRFNISELQSRAILEMRLQKLTNLESIKLEEELKEIIHAIKHLKQLLSSKAQIQRLISKETFEIAEKFGDERRTEVIQEEVGELPHEELIQPEQVVFILSTLGYVKRTPLASYRTQSRGGRGSATTSKKGEDTIQNVLKGSTTDSLFFVSALGKAYVIKLHKIPSGTRTSKGKHLRSLIGIGKEENITQVLLIPDFTSKSSIIFATKRGVVKRTKIEKFSNVRTRGIASIKLSARDALMSAIVSDGTEDIYFVTSFGRGLRVTGSSARPMERATRGVQGIKLTTNDHLVGAITLNKNENMLLVTNNGYAKRVRSEALQRHSRATQGQQLFPVTKRTGNVVRFIAINSDDAVFIATSAGNAVVIESKEISLQQRTAKGVRCINVGAGESVVEVERFVQADR